MKKFKLILALCIGTAFFSCEDSYDIVQDGEFGEDATFRTIDDMQAYLFETYDRASLYSEIEFTTIFTDESAIGPSNTNQNLDLYKFTLNNADGDTNGIWAGHYNMINLTNRLLRGAARITPTDAELPRYNSIIAQAKALRAFGHFQLMSFFSEDMTDDSSLGVILMDRVPAVDEELPRNTTGEIWAFIESDLAAAEADLGDPMVGLPTTARPWTYVNQNFINAFRARMYLYRENFTLAEQYADWVINNSGLVMTPAGVFTTTAAGYTEFAGASTASPYRKMWNDVEQGEIIFGLRRVLTTPAKESIASIWFTNRSDNTGAPLHDIGRTLFNLLADQNGDGVLLSPTATLAVNSTDRDVRRVAFVDRTSVINADPDAVPDQSWKMADYPLVDKYPGIGAGAVLTNDTKVFRLTEMFLIKAEVYANAGQINGASNSVAAILKQIRDVRTIATRPSTAGVVTPAAEQPLPNYADATAAWFDISQERRRELCFEGHRYIDLLRLGSKANTSIDRYAKDCAVANAPVCTLPLTDHRFRLPIPLNELIGNSNIQQNEGY